MPRSLLIAHRGASAQFPEHSRQALQEALVQGADGVEVDLRLTADGRLLLHHDANLRRCCGRSQAVRSLDSRERGRFNTCARQLELSPEAPLLLEEALELLPRNRLLFLELKEGPEQIPPLRRALGRRRDNLVLISFHLDSLVAAGVTLKGLPRLWLRGGDGVAASTTRRWIRMCRRHGLQGLDVEAPLATPALLEGLFGDGLSCGAWTVDDARHARELERQGLHWITTNGPGELRQGMM